MNISQGLRRSDRKPNLLQDIIVMDSVRLPAGRQVKKVKYRPVLAGGYDTLYLYLF